MVNREPTYNSGSGTSHHYIVEARCTFPDHKVINGVLLTREWKRLHTVDVPSTTLVAVGENISVPSRLWPCLAREHGLLERGAAFALAARFQVESEALMGGSTALCVETRLVEVKLTHSYSIEEVGVCEPLSLFEELRYLKSTPRAEASNATVEERTARRGRSPS
jgi:hypothetical protein